MKWILTSASSASSPSFVNLLGFPIGTAIGIYAIWVLLNDQAKPLFT